MKKLLIALLLLPLLSAAQISKQNASLSDGVQDSLLGTSFILKDNTIVFQKVYVSTLNKEDLNKALREFLPSVKSFQLTESSNQNQYQFSGKLSDFPVNYRKYGGSFMGTSALLNEPLNANVIIQVKDQKYRVLISDIIFKHVKLLPDDPGTNIFMDDMFTKKKRKEFRNNATATKTAQYIDKDFSDSFDLATNKKASTDF